MPADSIKTDADLEALHDRIRLAASAVNIAVARRNEANAQATDAEKALRHAQDDLRASQQKLMSRLVGQLAEGWYWTDLTK